MFPRVPAHVAAACRTLVCDDKFDIQLALGVVRNAGPMTTLLMDPAHLLACLDSWALEPWPQMFAQEAEPGTLCFQVGTDQAAFAFPANLALHRERTWHYMALKEPRPDEGRPDLSSLLARSACNMGKDVLIVAREPLGQEALLLATCAGVRGETVYLLDCDVEELLSIRPSLRYAVPEPCFEHVTLNLVDPRVTMASVEPETLCERRALSEPSDLDLFLDAVTTGPYVGQVDLLRAYFRLSPQVDFDFGAVRKALEFVRVRYPLASGRCLKTDEFGNDPVPSYVLADNTLCLGGVHHGHKEMLELLGIGAVVVCGATEFVDQVRRELPHVELLVLGRFRDDHWTSARGYFEQVVAFIRMQRLLGRTVLVHCHVGSSRSVTMVVIYLMAEFGLSAAQAFRAVRRVRPRAYPSLRFQDDVLRWEFHCLGRRETWRFPL